ncbi:unnamed protein product [Cylindrotheca closterium]|uniref:Tetratricopeptide SHNi-TPR domain-containing protein n=1 Tax=Cylindrotheca closterium TaxID=2856 RepID=A0AAD2CQV4_9STRA|nr:unnamed protein product [Cylindrotheca closterium]
MSGSKEATNACPVPIVTLDPRFKAGRNMIQKGLAAHGAVEIFESLAEEVGNKFGESSIESSPAYFEYGNALLRAMNRRKMEAEESNDAGPTDDPKEAIAKAAEKRLLGQKQESEDKVSKPPARKAGETDAASKEPSNTAVIDETENENDENLALEMMENAYSIMDEYSSSEKGGKYQDWVKEALPRALLGIGDTLSMLDRHADAADAYSRALEWYQGKLDSFAKDTMSIEYLTAHRRVCEATVLVAEELLFCPSGEDIVTSETQSLIVKADEQIDYITGYYDRARDSLQDTLFFMAKLAASGTDITAEKNEVCHLSTMIMGVGMSLAEAQEDEVNDSAEEPTKKKAKL